MPRPKWQWAAIGLALSSEARVLTIVVFWALPAKTLREFWRLPRAVSVRVGAVLCEGLGDEVNCGTMTLTARIDSFRRVGNCETISVVIA